MDSDEEYFSEDSDKNKSSSKKRCIRLLISSLNNQTFIHTSIKNSDNDFNVDADSRWEELGLMNVKHNIDDINLTTKKMNPNQIKSLAINLLLNNTQISPIFNIEEEVKTDTLENNFESIKESDDEDCGLSRRNVGQKLTKDQIFFIRNVLNQNKFSIKKLSQKFRLSSSTIYKILNMKSSDIDKGPAKNFTCLKVYEKYKLLKEIVLNSIYPINANQATKSVNSILKTEYKPNLIRKLLKDEMKCSFKRVKPRPSNININKVHAIRFSQEISLNTLIINIDESSINRHIKCNFSWSLKGISKEAINSPFSGFISLIMAIWSNGAWMAYMTNQSIDGNKFSTFLSNLSKWIKNSKNFGYDNVIIILDNSSVHKTKEVKSRFSKMKAKVLYLAPYSPQFAPIEMYFGLLKRYLWRISENKNKRISIKESTSIIIKAMKEIKADVIVKMFNNLLSWINKIV